MPRRPRSQGSHPFCRTLEEGRLVQLEMAKHGLRRGQDGLEVYVMCEIPSNVILADEFAEIFDGFSIGSNDLTQLTLGVDRDSSIVAHVLDECNPAVKRLIARGDSNREGRPPQDRHLRPGPQRLPRFRPVPRRAGDRQHLAEPRHRPEDDPGDPGEREGARRDSRGRPAPGGERSPGPARRGMRGCGRSRRSRTRALYPWGRHGVGRCLYRDHPQHRGPSAGTGRPGRRSRAQRCVAAGPFELPSRAARRVRSANRCPRAPAQTKAK